MECKFNIEDLTEEKLEELIDTLWNVNDGKRGKNIIIELIDTLWNVNDRTI